MTEFKLSIEVAQLVEQLAPLLTKRWSSRPAKKVAAKAVSLQFWQDGMIKELKLIAAKKASSKDFARLQLEFEDTEKEVTEIVKELMELRSALIDRKDGPKIIERIEQIIYGPVGKLQIRRDIDFILNNPNNTDEIAVHAQSVCNAVDAFNQATASLHRLVYSS